MEKRQVEIVVRHMKTASIKCQQRSRATSLNEVTLSTESHIDHNRATLKIYRVMLSITQPHFSTVRSHNSSEFYGTVKELHPFTYRPAQ